MGTHLPRTANLGSELAEIRQQIRNMALSPTAQFSNIKEGATTVLNGTSVPRSAFGQYTFTAGPYVGVRIYSTVYFDSAGKPAIIEGDQPDGTTGLGFYTPAQVKIMEISEAGLTSYDAGEHPRVQIGVLPNGDYGMAIYNPANDGTYQEVRPVAPGEVDATVAITSTSAVSAGGPSVTTTVGASGVVAVTAAAFIGTTAAGLTGDAIVFVDGVASTASIGVSAAAGATAVSASNTRQISGLTPGSHTFELRYQTSAGTTNFSARTLTVQPI